MVTLKEYLDLMHSDVDPDRHEKIVEYNKALVEEYPFLKLDKEYRWTWMDDMPDGWRLAFGKQMLDELKKDLIKHNFLNEYNILQIKEKYGTLRWYDGGIPKDCNVHNIIDKYEDMSEKVCQICGKPAEVMTTGWISSFCKDCVHKFSTREDYVEL